MAYFAVTCEQGPAWVSGRAMRDQALWTEHATFINSRVSAGFVIAAGPLGTGTIHRALLIVHAAREAEVREGFAADPWMQEGILRIVTVESWRLLASDERLDRVLEQITHAPPPP